MYDEKDEIITFTGRRYPIGELRLTQFSSWVKANFNVDFSEQNPSQELPSEDQFPKPLINEENLALIRGLQISFSVKGVDR